MCHSLLSHTPIQKGRHYYGGSCGETAVQAASRAALAIAEIEEICTEGNVLVVSHKATIQIILCSLLDIDLGRYHDLIEMPVATVTLMQFDRHGPLLKRLSDRAHLPEALRNCAGS